MSGLGERRFGVCERESVRWWLRKGSGGSVEDLRVIEPLLLLLFFGMSNTLSIVSSEMEKAIEGG